MVRWKKVIGIILMGYVLVLFALGIISTLLIGPGDVVYLSINGRTNPDLHYHTNMHEWIEVWWIYSLLSLPALVILFYFDPLELNEHISSNLD